MSYTYIRSIFADHEVTKEMLNWAKSHCPSYITCDIKQTAEGSYYQFYFHIEKDYVMFLLRWGATE